jgi:hypothetical protein
MKAYEGMDVQIHIFLTSALAGGEWSASHPGRFTLWERAPGTHWIGNKMKGRLFWIEIFLFVLVERTFQLSQLPIRLWFRIKHLRCVNVL